MSKTIEEAANEYAANWEAKHNIHNPELYDLIVDTYKASAERIMSHPLASRLTAEEKERVREEYNWAKVNLSQLKEGGFNELDPDVVLCSGVIRTLNRIFGKEFFKEGE